MAHRTCSVPHCDRRHHGLGVCIVHYRRIPRPPRRPAEERFWDRVDASGDCWEWTGNMAGSGRRYGQLQVDGRERYAHRFAWETLVGPVPDGFFLDHLCRNTRCVNPDHLEVVTHAENMRRSPVLRRGGKSRPKPRPRRMMSDKECFQGHPWTPENTRFSKGYRQCRACARERWHARYSPSARTAA